MTEEELKKLLNELRALPAETECVEFEEAKNTFHFIGIGKYFSALSNEAGQEQLAEAFFQEIGAVLDKADKTKGGKCAAKWR